MVLSNRHRPGSGHPIPVELTSDPMRGIDGPPYRCRRALKVDADGVLRWKQVGLLGVTYSDVGTIAEQVRKLWRDGPAPARPARFLATGDVTFGATRRRLEPSGAPRRA
ncbi:hypothetical protein [Frankia gtarii]|uniref:hypothetical protein n=1 Tax=Frankia gtarii TaxID=2950102 RepID=UPI0021BE1AF3|nr:hypothetical protein [Frankia gtarii]